MEAKKTKYPWVDTFFKNLISPLSIKVADRLKDNFITMKDVYAEIEPQMSDLKNISKEHSADDILSAIIDGAVLYNEESAREELQRIKAFEDLHTDIIKATEKLSKLLDRFYEQQNKGLFHSSAYMNLFHLIDKAGKRNYRYEHWIKPLLDKVRHFDSKYYPDLQDILSALKSEVADAEVYPSTEADAAALYSQKASRTVFLRYFLIRLHEARGLTIPHDLRLSNKSIISIVGCALDLKKPLSDSEISQAKSKVEIFKVDIPLD